MDTWKKIFNMMAIWLIITSFTGIEVAPLIINDLNKMCCTPGQPYCPDSQNILCLIDCPEHDSLYDLPTFELSSSTDIILPVSYSELFLLINTFDPVWRPPELV